ncbi:MAG: GntR family transcriptional regulator [Candidatus Omnitrophota bacterium]|nr:MAG: GntR family transcriptional regulator [Candidatus Omnitrophota bacterium]
MYFGNVIKKNFPAPTNKSALLLYGLNMSMVLSEDVQIHFELIVLLLFHFSEKGKTEILKNSINFKIEINRDSTVPAYHQLTNQMIAFIQREEIHIGEPLPPENAICELSGLSRMTVRRAMEQLNQQGLVVAERGRGTFVVSKMPRAENRTSIGFALRPDRYLEEDPFYSQVFWGVTHEAQQRRLHLSFLKGETLVSDHGLSETLEILNHLHGLIIAGQMPESFLEYLRKIRIPCVFLNYHSPKYAFDAVTSDQREIGRLVGRHLAILGHRSVLYLSGEPENVAHQDRLRGFREMFVEPGKRDCHVIDGGKHTQSGRKMIAEALERKLPFSAVAAGNDMIAIGAMNELQDRGFQVPTDVSVCGIDNVTPAESCRPALTTVHIEKQEMGARAIQLLLKRLEIPKAVCETVFLRVKLMERRSTGPVSEDGKRGEIALDEVAAKRIR